MNVCMCLQWLIKVCKFIFRARQYHQTCQEVNELAKNLCNMPVYCFYCYFFIAYIFIKINFCLHTCIIKKKKNNNKIEMLCLH